MPRVRTKIDTIPKRVRAEVDRFLKSKQFTDYRGLSKLLFSKHHIEVGRSALCAYGRRLKSRIDEDKAEHRALMKLPPRVRAIAAGLSEHPEILESVALRLIGASFEEFSRLLRRAEQKKGRA